MSMCYPEQENKGVGQVPASRRAAEPDLYFLLWIALCENLKMGYDLIPN